MVDCNSNKKQIAIEFSKKDRKENDPSGGPFFVKQVASQVAL
jgi:hypothetical protein